MDAKRLIDLGVAASAVVLLAPVMVIVAIWVRLDSTGPAFYRQTRIGRGGRPFEIFKFRTMHAVQPPGAPLITTGADTRLTRLGAWLRRRKVDELPQFINVLRGDMSLVGPRPEVAAYVDRYSVRDRDIVLSVRPGLTDFATMKFADEPALLAKAQDPQRYYVEYILPRKLRLCRFYVRKRSIGLDIYLLWSTLRLLAGAGGRAIRRPRGRA